MLKNEILLEHEFPFQKIPVLQNIRYKPFTIVVKLPILNVYGGHCYAPVIVLYEIS